MDEIVIKFVTLGVPGLILAIAMRATVKTGNSALWTGLEMLGSPFGMRGGLCVLVIVGLIANVLIKFGVDGLMVRTYQKRRNSEPHEKLLTEIDGLPISQDLKIKLKWTVIHNHISWRPNFKQLFNRGFVLGTVAIALFSLTGYLGGFSRPLELTSHFKLQYLVLSFCPFFFFLIKRQKLWTIVSLACILINLVQIVPWYLPQSVGDGDINGQKLRFLQSNVFTDNTQYSKVISLVKEEQPDVAVFLEVNKFWAKELEVLQDILPYKVVNQDSDKFGTAIYSKLPLKNTSVGATRKNNPSDLTDNPVGSPPHHDNPSEIKSLGGGRKVVLADVTIQGQVVSIIATHPNIPTNKAGFVQRNRQLAAIADYVAQVKNPLVALGDFNITMWSPYYEQFISKTKLRNARKGFGILPTWPTFRPLLYIPIDHCLVSRNIKVLNIRRGREVGSDHLPLITDLLIPANPPGDKSTRD